MSGEGKEVGVWKCRNEAEGGGDVEMRERGRVEGL